ncbi:MAG: hypothetical protein NTY90_02600 [Candidatus Micrarchaeota archaeon]|nr:hypothetical protein [Candidatus Micrarchaeota archaeon]
MYELFAGAAVVLMLLDGFLTELGFRWYRKFGARFLAVESFELNPAWAKAAVSGRLAFNPWRLAGIAFVAAMMFMLRSEWLVGAVFFPYLFVFIRHLNGLFGLRNYAGNARGRLWLSRVFGARTTAFSQLAEGLVPLAAYFFVPRAFFAGGVAGCVILAAYIYIANFWRGRNAGKRGGGRG